MDRQKRQRQARLRARRYARRLVNRVRRVRPRWPWAAFDMGADDCVGRPCATVTRVYAGQFCGPCERRHARQSASLAALGVTP